MPLAQTRHSWREYTTPFISTPLSTTASASSNEKASRHTCTTLSRCLHCRDFWCAPTSRLCGAAGVHPGCRSAGKDAHGGGHHLHSTQGRNIQRSCPGTHCTTAASVQTISWTEMFCCRNRRNRPPRISAARMGAPFGTYSTSTWETPRPMTICMPRGCSS
ncbi:hypothetical protein B0H10DRAFT_2428048 [Mycena sp. CBHHK59/15]|nr:hypothetical protein B0H10DRAFT_2428048 [Mycena sp. CBHHK59/15]